MFLEICFFKTSGKYSMYYLRCGVKLPDHVWTGVGVT